jgi:uncharacterized protein with GYD domain
MSKPTFISLVKMTKTGKAEITETFARRDRLAPIWDLLGVELVDYYATLGRYDFVMIYKAPNASAMVNAMMEVGKLGAIKTETLSAVEADVYQSIIARMSDGD